MILSCVHSSLSYIERIHDTFIRVGVEANDGQGADLGIIGERLVKKTFYYDYTVVQQPVSSLHDGARGRCVIRSMKRAAIVMLV